MDIQQELERSIGHGPVLPTPQQRVAAGRRALRRRRATVAAGAAAVLVAVAAPFAINGSGATQGTELPPAAPPPAQETVDAAPLQVDEPAWPAGEKEAAFVDIMTGELRIHPDAVVLQRIDDLYPGKATESVALDLRLDGERHWIELEWDDGGTSGTYGGPGDDFYTDFDDFVAKATSGGGMTSGPPARDRNRGDGSDEMPVPGEVTGLTVEGERFVSDGTITVLEQQPSPDLPESFALSSDDTAAAYVEQDGVRYLVLARPDGLIVVESAGNGDSLDALLEWARERYVSGEGLL